MNLRTINIIIRREYLNKVKKKSFLLITFLGPIFFAAVCILPSIIMVATKEEAKNIAVVDASGIVQPTLEDSETIHYIDCSGMSLEEAKAKIGTGPDAVLSISALTGTNNLTAEVFSLKPLGMDMIENVNRRINKALEDYRIGTYSIENLDAIMKEVKADVSLKTYTMGEDGRETISESGVYMAVSIILGMVIYLFVTLFGSSVMSSVIEEKSSRVVEVLVSSVKSTELMFGKIIGIALVALTQFLLWIILTLAIIGAAGAVMGKDLLSKAQDMAAVEMPAGMDSSAIPGMNVPGLDASEAAESEPVMMEVITSTLSTLPVGRIAVGFLLYFILGYLLYASLFAAIGSAVESEGDTQQLSLPLTVPLMLGLFIAIYAFKAPDSGIVFWGSMIPFTSPIVMLARLPFGVAAWEVIVSLLALALTFFLCAYLSAKIYKVGILMFGKKSTWKDLWKWLRQN